MKIYSFNVIDKRQKAAKRAQVMRRVQQLACCLPSTLEGCEQTRMHLMQITLCNDWCLTRKDLKAINRHIKFYETLVHVFEIMKEVNTMRSNTYNTLDLTTARGQHAQIRIYNDGTAEIMLYANGAWQKPATGYFYAFKNFSEASKYFEQYKRTIHA